MLPTTSNEIDICAYEIVSQSPNSQTQLWQVEYFNTLYPGGLGLDNCAYHDICPGYMIQINVTNLMNFNNPRFNMISTPTSIVDGTSTYSIYGSNSAGILGTELFSDKTLNSWLPLPILESYIFLNFVATSSSSSETSGLLLQKLEAAVPCPPSSAPSASPIIAPSVSPSTAAPSQPTFTPSQNPTFEPTVIPSAPTSSPTIAPSAPTQNPTTIQLKTYESPADNSIPVLMHQFQFLGSQAKSISTSCQQYVIDKIQNSTASVCNNVEIYNGQAIFQPIGPPEPFIQINNIVELSDVNAFSIALWVTLGATPYNSSFPLFSFGDISFPDTTTVNYTTYPYEMLGCYTTQIAKIKMILVSSNKNIHDCLNYAKGNSYNYFTYGPSFCRFVKIS